MRKLIYIIPFFIYALVVFNLSSCKKDIFLSNEHLSFSADTVLFDTVFTTIGSTTKRFKIYNNSDKPVKIDKIQLQGGQGSPYRINVDGISGSSFKDITIPAKDSLFCFVEVTLGENEKTYPFIVTDSILFKTNNKEQKVILAAWGRDAYFHYNDANSDEDPWQNDKPHVIYGVAFVDTDKTLTIQAGTEIFLHKGSMIYVRGKLHIEGDYNNKVTIQGDRLEEFYKDVSGQYYGIYFDQAKSSTIDNLIMKNGTAGIHIYGNNTTNLDYTLTIKNSEIFNNSSYGIFNYSGGKIYGENLNIHSNGAYAYFVLEGGDCNFRHSQFLSWGADGNQPAVAIRNYYTHSDDGITYVGSINEMKFYNSIIYGSGDIQIGFDTLSNSGATLNYEFNSNCIKQTTTSINSNFTNNILADPKFESIENKEYKIKPTSPCVDNGNINYSTPTDIENNFRNGVPDIGAFEVN